MKKLFVLLFCAAALAWAGCSDDEKDNGPDLRGDAGALIGTWEVTMYRCTGYENGKKVGSISEPEDGFTLELTADGRYHWREEGDRISDSDDGYYTYDTETHIFRLSHEVDFGLQEGIVTRLTDAVLECSYTNEYEDEGIRYKDDEVLIFRRAD